MTPEQLLDTPNLIEAGVAGDECRRRIHGIKTTFNRVFEIHVDAPLHTLPPRVQAGEFRIIGTPPTLESLIDAVRAAAAVSGGVPVTVASVSDLMSLPESIGAVAAALLDAGAAAIVRLSIDRVEEAADGAQQIRAAGLPVLTLCVEDHDASRRLELCRAARAIQNEAGGFKAFAPLPRQPSVTEPTTGYDDVKAVALARVTVENIPSIQVDWVLCGPKLAQVALTVGADDVDNVAAQDPGILGTRRSPLEEIKGNITAASLEPLERDGLFRVNSQLPTRNSHQ